MDSLHQQRVAKAAPARVVVVGGGYSGAAAAVQLANALGADIDITIVEPRAELARGIAYSTRDPDHRLNGPLANHLLDPARPDDLRSWCERRGIFSQDPDARAPNGGTYIRRGDFGAYAGDAIRGLQERGARIRHHRSTAIRLGQAPAMAVATADGAQLRADLVIVATGNGAPLAPKVISHLSAHPHVIEDPFDAEAVKSIPRSARVLLMGSGLTALDVISTLVRGGHAGGIVSISRHGARPRSHRSNVVEGSALPLLERIEGPIPEWVEAPLASGRVRMLSQALRNRIEDVTAQAGDWQDPFDELRNAVWQFWPRLPIAERRRFLRHLRIHYDTHRFRVPPQNEEIVRRAGMEGRLSFDAGTIQSADVLPSGALRVRWKRRREKAEGVVEFDALVNCTGLDPEFGARSNPFLASLIEQKLIQRDPTGLGFAVDAQCRPLAADGTPSPGLRLIGPPSAGALGDPLGVIFIAPRIRRVLPGIIAEIEAARLRGIA